MKLRFLAPVLGALILTSGCAIDSHKRVKAKPEPTYHQAANDPFIDFNYIGALDLIADLKKRNVLPGSKLIIATVVNIDDLNSSSTLGRSVSEQVSARFTKSGYHMVELKFRNDVFMSQGQGELMLTREIKDLATAHSAQAVVVGTYAESREFAYINLKVINPSTNTVLAVTDYALPIDQNNRRMLRRTR